MIKSRGIIVHPEELTDRLPEQLEKAGLNTLGIHPAGGRNAANSLEEAIHLHRQRHQTEIIRVIRSMGIKVAYQAHVMSWLLPRSEFDAHPERFRTDEHGERVRECNLCVSSAEALEYISERVCLLAEMLDTGNNLLYFWPDDISGARCHCELCEPLSASDQQMIMVNTMLRALRKLDPDHRLCYLAYHDSITPPTRVKPDPGVFLEYAPFDRELDTPLGDPASDKNAVQTKPLPGLLRLFGREDATALDYWMDNSMRSDWKKPPRPFVLNEDVLREDVKYYSSMGLEAVTCFGCFLGPDYAALYGEPPIKAYGKLVSASSS